MQAQRSDHVPALAANTGTRSRPPVHTDHVDLLNLTHGRHSAQILHPHVPTGGHSHIPSTHVSWLCRGVGVMEDEGLQQDHTSGLAATDGTWRHIAVTWESTTGRTVLYDNGRKVRQALGE